MRTLVFTLSVALVGGACSLVFDSQGSSSNTPPDADVTDAIQDHDGGHSTADAGCDPDPADGGFDPGDAGSYPDAELPLDADVTDAALPPDASW